MPTRQEYRDLLARITALAERWGCTLIAGSRTDLITLNRGFDDDYYRSPSSSGLGLFWEGRSIIYAWEVSWSDLIHELGHIVACKKPPAGNTYVTAREELGMLGWEYAVARRLGITHRQWVKEQHDSLLVDDRPFQEISPKRQQTFINRRVQVARNKGLIKNRLTPVAIR